MKIVITGNPGVGKHTLADKLAKKLEYKIVDINKIAFDENLFEKNNETNDVDVSKLQQILQNKIADESCIIVGHLASYVLPKTSVNKIIILRKNPYELIPIYEKREYSKKKIQENVESEILGIISHDSLQKFENEICFEVDASSKSIDELSSRVFSIIKGELKKSDVIDWLTLIKENNDFKKFFSY